MVVLVAFPFCLWRVLSFLKIKKKFFYTLVSYSSLVLGDLFFFWYISNRNTTQFIPTKWTSNALPFSTIQSNFLFVPFCSSSHFSQCYLISFHLHCLFVFVIYIFFCWPSVWFIQSLAFIILVKYKLYCMFVCIFETRKMPEMVTLYSKMAS